MVYAYQVGNCIYFLQLFGVSIESSSFLAAQHKFFEKWKVGSAAMFPKLEKARQVRASMALQVQTLAPAAAGDQV